MAYQRRGGKLGGNNGKKMEGWMKKQYEGREDATKWSERNVKKAK
jgi:hypothetical protein